MSFIIINGKEVETLDSEVFNPIHPNFFEPRPISPKKNVLFADYEGNIKFKIEDLDDNNNNDNDNNNNDNISILGKRKLVDAFDLYGDEERYGQMISNDFFTTNIGHGVVNKDTSWEDFLREEKIKGKNPEEVLNWCYEYLNSKNISKNS